MTWRIPPIGWCSIHLAVHNDEVPAETVWKGTAVCRDHLTQILDPIREEAKQEAGME